MSKEEMIRYSLEKDNILDNFKKSELMWFMKILYKENKQLKEVIEEVRQLTLKQIDISKKEIDRTLHLHQYDERQGLLIGQEQDIIEIQEKLLQILDKVKEN